MKRTLLHTRPGHWSLLKADRESLVLTTTLANGDSGPGLKISWRELGDFGFADVRVPSWRDSWAAFRELPEVFEVLASAESTELEYVKARLLAAGWTEIGACQGSEPGGEG